MANQDALAFKLEWYDKMSCQKKIFLVRCFPDNTIEMHDTKNNKKFLRRSLVDGITRKSFYKGAMMTIHSRQMKVVDYGNLMTCKALEVLNQRTLALVKPDGLSKLGAIFDVVIQNELRITQVKMVQMKKEHVLKLYWRLAGQPSLPGLVTFLTSSPVVAVELLGNNAIEKWRAVMGPTDPVVARTNDPLSIRARFGADKMYNAVHGSDSSEDAAKELSLFFPCSDTPSSSQAVEGFPPRTTATCHECTCVIIQPHAVKEGNMGKILMEIQNHGFEINAMQLFNLNQATAMEVFEIYKGVAPEYKDMVEHICSGACLVLELGGYGRDTVQMFRRLAGNRQVEAAKTLHPETIRAKFGHNNILNGVHCTDLPSDGVLDSEYFFRTLQMNIS